MFYLYATFVDATPIAAFSTMQAARDAASRWFVGSNWIVRDVATFDFYKA